MKSKKMLMLSLATASLLTLSGCTNCKFCDWFSSCCSKAKAKLTGGQTTGRKKSRSKKAPTASIVSVENNEDFQALLQAEKPVVVKLHAAWCGACEEMTPVFHELAQQLPGITFAELDIDKVPQIAKEYNIRGVPTFLMFKDGKEMSENDRVIGVIDQAKFKEILQTTLLK